MRERQLFAELNHTKIDYPTDKTIVDLIEEQVSRTPESIAVVYKSEKLSYKKFDERANQLAHYLRREGVKAQTLIPICIDRSTEMLIGIWATLKAGCAYVPIDPEYPQERIRFILEDIGATIAITSSKCSVKIQGIDKLQIIKLDEIPVILEQEQVTPGTTRPSPYNLAYVIYTSGSTGQPKGVMIEHRSLVNYILNSRTNYINENEGGSGSFMHLSFTFDASLTAMFMPLVFGKSIIVGSKNSLEVFEDPNLFKYAPYDFIKITPSHLELLRFILENTKTRLTNKLVIGGETLHLQQLDYLVEKGIDVEVVNEYGPTEATVGCSIYSFQTLDNNEELNNKIPIGKPISNTEIYILNEQDEILPTGEIGEICIGGAGIARGYLNRTELTEKKFIRNPFTQDPLSRIYKTGDLGIWLPDGNIEYHGRKDDQVKIEGYRIELGEIESALRQHPTVQQVAVIVREDTSNKKRLVAYVVAGKDYTPSANELLSFIGEKLPLYMLPSSFVFLERLPLTNNGKIDRSALPFPDQVKTQLEKRVIAPRNKVETILKKIWEECLNIRPIGVKENFFDLGGNSIDVVNVCSKIKKAFNKQLTLATILNTPTIEKLAIIITENVKISYPSLVAIQPNGSKPPLFCMHAGAGTILLYRSLSQQLGNEQPVYGLQAKGLDGRETPHTRIEDMAAHYIKEIQAVQPEGPYYLAGYCFGGVLAFEMAQQLIHNGQKVALVANFNGVSPTYTHPSCLSIAEEENDSTKNTNEPSNKVDSNGENFKFLSVKDKVIYLIKLLTNYNQRLKFKKLLYKLYLFFNRPLPEALAKVYLYETNDDIVKAYKPKPYPGKIIVFRSPKIYHDPYLGWRNLVTEGIETNDIPGDHKNRREIMNEPYIQDTGKKLSCYLHKSSASVKTAYLIDFLVNNLSN